jgi:ribose-phosphate pyrophosphokinase
MTCCIRESPWNSTHPLAIFGGSQCGELTQAICSVIDRKANHCEVKPFPNGETMVKLHDDVRGKDVFVIVSVCRQHKADEQGYTGINDCLMELLVFGDALRRASAHRITAVIPHFGYARQDRKAEGRTPITAKLFADMIVAAGYNRVLTMDLHVDQIQGFFPGHVPLDHLNAGPLFAAHFNELNLENVVVLSPDVGNIKKADKYRRGFKFPASFAFIDKVRDQSGDVKARNIVGDVEGKTVIFLDDIISTAGTMRQAMDLAQEHGAECFYLAATHGECVGPAIERLKSPLIQEICITDTVPTTSRMRNELPLQVLSVTEMFGQAIARIHCHESISEMLGEYS